MKFYGPIGFSETKEIEDGVWRSTIVEKKYTGDILQYSRRRDSGEHINDGLRVNVQISILCLDPWFHNNLSQIQYVEYMGAKWKVETIGPSEYPSVLLTLGGLYHGDEPEEIEEAGASSDSETYSGD